MRVVLHRSVHDHRQRDGVRRGGTRQGGGGGTAGAGAGGAQQQYDQFLLQVTGNHGHPDYTCVYRFRVHSAPTPAEAEAAEAAEGEAAAV